MIEADPTPAVEDVRADVATLYRDGIVARPGAFSREWAEQLRQDMLTAFWEAIQRPGGAVGRGPRRWYIEGPSRGHHGVRRPRDAPWVTAMSEAVWGNYEIVEARMDTPFEGAKTQPWHRDFPSPPETYRDHRITSWPST